jgi:hypothetical protein
MDSHNLDWAQGETRLSLSLFLVRESAPGGLAVRRRWVRESPTGQGVFL